MWCVTISRTAHTADDHPLPDHAPARSGTGGASGVEQLQGQPRPLRGLSVDQAPDQCLIDLGVGFDGFSQSPRAALVVGPVRATGTRRHHSGSRLCMSTDFATHGNRVEAWLACPHRRLRGDPPLHRHRAGRSVPVVSCEDGSGHGSRVADMDESRCRGAVSQAAVGVVPAQRQDVVEAQGPGPRRRPCRCSHRPRHPAARPLRPCRRAALHGPDGVRSSARRRPRSPGCCAARGRGGSSPRGGAAACAGRLARCSSAGGGGRRGRGPGRGRPVASSRTSPPRSGGAVRCRCRCRC